jgi:isopenicillin N synthase-like dioxygenase
MIPIINFKDKDVIDKMRKAYTTVGFVIFTNVYDEWASEFNDWLEIVKTFFALPLATKQKYIHRGVSENVGYSYLEQERLSPNQPGDLKEYYNWASINHMSYDLWPNEIPEFKPLAQKIIRLSKLFSLEFLHCFEQVLHLRKNQLVEMHVDNVDMMRFIHYPTYTGAVKPGQLRANTHTDYDTITLLYRFDDVAGLEVLNQQSREWVAVPVVENSVVVNVGDMFQRWSNDVLKSTPHRVTNASMEKPRYSMPHFVGARRDVVVENLIPQQKAKYPPIKAYDYLQWRLAQSYQDDKYVENTTITKEGQQHLPVNL